MSETRTVLLKVDGWSNTRFGRVESNLIAFEVMWLGCACHICFAHLNAVMNRMKDSEVRWQVRNVPMPEREGTTSTILMVKPKEMPERVDSYLSDLLGLQISEVA